MEIKEMPLEEKYDKLLDNYLLNEAINYALHKELGALDKYSDLYMKVQKKMLPSLLGPAFKVMKAITPGRAFKQVANQFVNTAQINNPLSNIELAMVSDREAVIRTENCVLLKKMRNIVKKADLDIDPKFMCEDGSKFVPGLLREFGIDAIMELEENGCITRAKLK